MKTVATILLIVLFIACEKNNDSNEGFEYDYKVTRSYHKDTKFDSTIFYYSADNKLVGYYDYILGDMHKYATSYIEGQININCKSSNILLSDKQFFIGDDDIIDSAYYQVLSDSFVLYNRFNYEGGKLISAERRNSIPELDYFYFYEQDVHVKDSVTTSPYITDNYKIIEYTYTDTLKPGFMVDESGLYDYPSKSDYLIRQTNTVDKIGGNTTMEQKYSYDIQQDKVAVQIHENGVLKETVTYYLEEE